MPTASVCAMNNGSRERQSIWVWRERDVIIRKVEDDIRVRRDCLSQNEKQRRGENGKSEEETGEKGRGSSEG